VMPSKKPFFSFVFVPSTRRFVCVCIARSSHAQQNINLERTIAAPSPHALLLRANVKRFTFALYRAIQALACR
jgi:hypothetical protein